MHSYKNQETVSLKQTQSRTLGLELDLVLVLFFLEAVTRDKEIG